MFNSLGSSLLYTDNMRVPKSPPQPISLHHSSRMISSPSNLLIQHETRGEHFNCLADLGYVCKGHIWSMHERRQLCALLYLSLSIGRFAPYRFLCPVLFDNRGGVGSHFFCASPHPPGIAFYLDHGWKSHFYWLSEATSAVAALNSHSSANQTLFSSVRPSH